MQGIKEQLARKPGDAKPAAAPESADLAAGRGPKKKG
jgi:hypothetical protein